MYDAMRESLRDDLDAIRRAGTYKTERVLQTPQSAHIRVPSGEVLNLCANNYLGLSNHPDVLQAAHEGLERWGFGLSSVRFICGTQQVHKDLEQVISEFMGYEDTILFGSCFDANGALFEALTGPEDAILSDALNHASIIDGIRLSKARRYRYAHSDMTDLEAKLQEAADARRRIIFTDGVFSMDGDIARLDEICDLADRYGALVGVDDCHATGVIGGTGRGSGEAKGVQTRIDLVTGTLGKALGGASGGYVTGKREIIEMLRQRGRPYLFSNALMPAIAHASIVAFRLVDESRGLLTRLAENASYFRRRIIDSGFETTVGETPIVPILVHQSEVATAMAERMLREGVYVIGFSHPVVPPGQARIRAQISAVHSREDLDYAIDAFVRVGRDLDVTEA